MHESRHVIVCVPAYNEANTIGAIIEKAKKFAYEVLVCDDGSIDNTTEVAEAAGARVTRHEFNKGYGAAIKGVRMEYATSGTDAAFNFGIRGNIPLELKGVQQISGQDLALFLDVGFMGEADYSNTEAFESSPLVNILVRPHFLKTNKQTVVLQLHLLGLTKSAVNGQC